MEVNSAPITKAHYSSKAITGDLDCLSLNSMEGVSNSGGKKVRRKFSALSLNTTTSKDTSVKTSSESYNLRDEYEIIETLGMGTYAYVRLATNKKSGNKVAIKTSRGQNSRELLQNEYNLLKRLPDDNIIRVLDFKEDHSKSESYMIMEYFEGQNLDEYIEEHGVFSEDEAKQIIKQILSSVQFLHELGIAHRDIKPENILINSQTEIKLIDFNISKAKTSQVLKDGEGKFTSIFHTQISSPLYCAPELKNSSSYTESIDIWGVGIILFSLLFGSLKSHSLNTLKTAEERRNSIASIVEETGSISDECRLFLQSLLASSAEDRPTAAESLDNNWLADDK